MFRGIVAIIAPATLWRNWWTVLCSVCVCSSIVCYRTCKNNSYNGIATFLLGVLCGLCSLFVLFFTKPIVGTSTTTAVQLFSGVVVSQQKINSYEFLTSTGNYLLYSNTPLAVGSQLLIHSTLTPAEVPVMQWSTILEASVFEDAFFFPRRLAMKGYAGSIQSYPGSSVLLGTTSLGFIDTTREHYKQRLGKKVTNSSLYALLLGMTIGDRSGFDKESYQRFIDTGLVHLLAVSGSNISYLSIILASLLFWLPFYGRVVFLGLAIVLYGLLCGMDSSVIRAVVVGLLGLVAVLSGRSTYVWRMLSIAAGAMLLRNPLLLRYDLGFLLSFAATSGIVAMSEYYNIHAIQDPIVDPLLRNWLLPTLGASIGVLPILLLFTGTMSMLGILVNFIIVPLVPVFLILFPLYFLPFLGESVLSVMTRSAEHLFILTRFIETHDWMIRIDSLLVRIFFLFRWMLLWAWFFSPHISDTEETVL